MVNKKYKIRIVPPDVHRDLSSPSKDGTTMHQRISVQIRKPNPMFTMWLEEMLAKAEEKNLMSKLALQKALTALQRYPLPIRNPRDCLMLNGFSRKLCTLLEKRHRAYLANGGTIDIDFTEKIERLLNDQSQEPYRLLTERLDGGKTAEDSPQLSTLPQEVMMDDSVFDHVNVPVTCDAITVTNARAILLVDTCETIGKSKSHLDKTLKELQQHNVQHEVRRLSVGDFVWIVKDNSGIEWLLPYIVERKRMDDLASSIKDGRFHEQKFRLRQCGLSHVIYLIEHLGNNRQVGVPESTLTQAALNTYVQDFVIKYTENHHHTVLYLATMTKLLNDNLKNKLFRNNTHQLASATQSNSKFNLTDPVVPVFSFDHFYKQSSKLRDCTVREIFMKQLLQIKLLSIEKVNSIVAKYPTPRALLRAYESCPSEELQQKLLDLQYGSTKRTVGLKLSKVIHSLFMNEQYL